jgi:hypothetical protein
MKTRKQNGRGLFYTRDSGGKHETTPGEYVGWARRKAEEIGVCFEGTPEAIEDMIQKGCANRGSLFIDYGVSGNVLARTGLNALLKEAIDHSEVSHVFIPRRDRLCRPDDPADGLRLENMLREIGVTLVFTDRVCPPVVKGRRRDIADMITTLIDYDKSGKERRELGEKMIYAQIRLSSTGFSVGGRAPYGFRRWLSKQDGTLVRQLADGERVRMPSHHVVWYPGPKEELDVIGRIVAMLETMPASRVAAILTSERIPSPDSDRQRTDNGVKHKTSGVWNQSTIINIARNPLIGCLAVYGRRSMGDQVRFTPTGPRSLEEEDLRADGKPKVVRNPDSILIKKPVPAHYEPIVEPDRHAKLMTLLDQRAGTQRGKPRSRNPNMNPLGCRVFDMGCGWPMYRQPYTKTFRYVCGLYQQSSGGKCAHNHVEGPTAVRFLLNCLLQRVLTPSILTKLEKRLRELATQESPTNRPMREIKAKERELAQLAAKLDRIGENLALAETQQQHRAVAKIFEETARQHKECETALANVRDSGTGRIDAEAELSMAMALAHKLSALAADSKNFAALGEAFRLVNVRLFLTFRPVAEGKRTLNKLVSGVVTFGSAPPPIEIYNGPTGRREITGSASSEEAEPCSARTPLLPDSSSGREGCSLGNVSRGDWIRTSDLLNPIQEAGRAKCRENAALFAT